MDRSSSLDRDRRSSAPIAVLPSPQDAHPPAQVARLVEQVPVTLGNIVGGGLFVALVYWLVYLHPAGHGAAS